MKRAITIADLLEDLFGPGDYKEVAEWLGTWDGGTPLGVLKWLRVLKAQGWKLTEGDSDGTS